MKKKVLKWILPLAVLAAGCTKDDINPGPVQPPAKGLYVLSEGNFGANNTRLGFYNLSTSTITGDYFIQQNPGASALGDTGNDMIVYGSKLYIVMSQSGNVTVLNAASGSLITRIDFTDNNTFNKEPRYAAGASGKVFVTCYDGTVRVIDTTSLTLTGSITVGKNPEGIVASNGKLYIANSGGLTATFDSTVSVVDIASLTETSKVTVGKNPQSLAVDNSGNLYVGCTGNYASIGPKLVKVNLGTLAITKSADTAVGRIRFYDNQLFVTGGYLGSPNVRALNTTDFAASRSNFVVDGTMVQSPYGIEINEANGDVYVTDAKNYVASGEVFCFDKNGRKKFSFSTSPGVNPNKVLFTY